MNEKYDKGSDEHPIYALGSVDPRCFANKSESKDFYSVISGVDTKIVFKDEEKKETIPNLQHLDYKKTVENGYVMLKGTAKVYVFGGVYDNWLGKSLRIIATATNEHGAYHTVMDEEICFNSESLVTTIDNIVIEKTYTFTGTKNESIEDHQKRMKTMVTKDRKSFEGHSKELELDLK